MVAISAIGGFHAGGFLHRKEQKVQEQSRQEPGTQQHQEIPSRQVGDSRIPEHGQQRIVAGDCGLIGKPDEQTCHRGDHQGVQKQSSLACRSYRHIVRFDPFIVARRRASSGHPFDACVRLL